MKPDRILLAELRAEEAFDYLRNVNSGHPGSITSVHAASAQLAFEQLVLLVKQSPAGRELARADIKNLLYLLVDVVIQCGIEHHERFIREIWYDPQRRLASGAHLRADFRTLCSVSRRAMPQSPSLWRSQTTTTQLTPRRRSRQRLSLFPPWW